MIDLRLLQTLRVLNELGTVTATAQALHLSPSAVSAQLRQLAQQAGVEPLRQDGRRLRLTPAGLVLLHHADVLCNQWERARAELSEHSGEEHRTLRVIGFATAIGSLLAPVAADLRRRTPPVRAYLTDADTRDGYRLLLTGDADIAVITPLPDSPPVDDPRFDQQPLLDDYLDLVVPEGHALAGSGGPVDLGAAATEPWIAPHHDQARLIEVLCGAAGFAPHTEHHADDWSGVLVMIGHGLGVCLVPRLVPLAAGLVRVPVRGTPPPYRRVLTCVRRDSDAQPAIAAGLAALRTRSAALTGDGA